MTKYNALQVDGLRDVLQNIATGCKSLGIDFFIVGAVARNLWYVDNGKEAKGTEDIDFGVYVADQEKYLALKAFLAKEFDYRQCSGNVFGLDTPNGKRVDLMPFGGIEENGEVVLKGKGMISIKLEGFEEVFLNGSIDTNIEKDTYRASSIPGIVILKLIAYDDRPDRRIKDIHDISRICRHYPDLESDVIYEHHLDLFGDISKDFHDKGHIVLGREMARIININTLLKKRVVRILSDAIVGKSHAAIQMISDPDKETIEEMIRILSNIKTGLETEI